MAVGFERDNLPSCWQEFNHINRYWDKHTGMATAKILPREFYVTAHNEAITTILGSCISACIRDPKVGIGGMNHFMLPISNSASSIELADAARYGNFAMEQMINDILKAGAKKENLEVKLFGGGKVLAGMNTLDIGSKNIIFVRAYVALEDLKVVSSDLGDVYPRKVLYYPDTGKVKMKKLKAVHNRTIADRESSYKQQINQEPASGDIELF